MRKNSIKNTRINQEVLKEISNCIRGELSDPRIHPFTSVTEVYVAPDLKTAKIYISVLAGAEEKADTLKGLKSASSFMRSYLARTLNMRYTPELTFILDESMENGEKMDAIIDKVMAENPVRDCCYDESKYKE